MGRRAASATASEPTSITNRASLKLLCDGAADERNQPHLRRQLVESLDRVLHGGSKLAVGAAELLEQHVAEVWEGSIAPICVSRAT